MSYTNHRYYLGCFLFLFCLACKEVKTANNKIAPEFVHKEELVPAFQNILDEANLNGAILIYDAQENSYYSNDFTWSKTGQLPASTFKIPNSIIALETKVIESDSTVLPWDGKKRMFKSWEKDLSFRDAIQASCLPCYQEIARKIGIERMQKYLEKLEFGKMQATEDSLDIFWLRGSSRISQFEQIDFLKRLYNSELDISERTDTIIKRMLIMQEQDGQILRGKTGWTMDVGLDNGWFVGYVESKGKVYYFATNVEPKADFDMTLFPNIRKEISYAALRQLKMLR